jgi:two-component system OmpR family response regulator
MPGALREPPLPWLVVRVLVVEDDTEMAQLLQRGLREDGYAVDATGDGREAVWMASETPYSTVVLDAGLPGIDGFEVCRTLRRSGCWTPIILLTARTSVGDRVEGLDAGADDYLAKPFTFAELSARVRALVRRGAVERPTVLAAGDLKLDPAQRRCWRGQVELALSAKEFALLELFMRNPGVVLSRSSILEQVWDFAYSDLSNVVDQYVGYLRRKVDKPFGRADIETIRGVGYRLNAVPE